MALRIVSIIAFRSFLTASKFDCACLSKSRFATVALAFCDEERPQLAWPFVDESHEPIFPPRAARRTVRRIETVLECLRLMYQCLFRLLDLPETTFKVPPVLTKGLVQFANLLI
eukprot:scaffold1667_cov173-Amphora_coffeaeformis.AAC.27